jgi:hypothetical protein
VTLYSTHRVCSKKRKRELLFRPVSMLPNEASPLQHAGLRRHEHALDHLVSSFTLDSTCVLYRLAGAPSSSPGKVRLTAQLVSFANATAVVHGFSEYKFGFVRLATVRPPISADEQRALNSRCEQRHTGFAIPFTHNNMYHSLFHAIPAFESFRERVMRQSDPSSSPPAFVPLFSQSAGIGSKTRASPALWHAWELTIRALTGDSADDIATATKRMVVETECTCFQVLHGSSAPFAPASRTAAPRLRAWARSVLQHAAHARQPRLAPQLMRWASPAGAATGPHRHGGAAAVPPSAELSSPEIIYVRRRASRVIVNEARDLASILAPTRALYLEDIPLTDQLLCVSEARALISAHGQALTLLVFLGGATGGGGGSVGDTTGEQQQHEQGGDAAPPARSILEILPPPVEKRRCGGGRICAQKAPFSHVYEDLAVANGVHYAHLVATYAPPCTVRRLRGARGEDMLRCNLTIAPARLAAGVEWLLRGHTL